MNEEFKIALRRLNHLANNLYTDAELDEARSPYVERTISEMKILIGKMEWEYFYGRSPNIKAIEVDEDMLRGIRND